MFRRNEDKESADQSQASQPDAGQSPFGASAANNAAAPKPASPVFGAFSSAPAADSAKPATAPLTTQQVGLGASGATNNSTAQISPKPISSTPAAQSYNKIPSPTSAPAPIPAAASYAAGSSSKVDGVEAERRLTVGYGITLTGEVSDCDRLVIYGKVNAKLQNVKFLQISDSGKFNGSASIDQAEISGVFEGELKVSNNITITSTGRVNGKITYGSIEIRPGGKFTGEIVEDASASQPNKQLSSEAA
jgi:cytoskeletal protein CcmA (bactofilin family)